MNIWNKVFLVLVLLLGIAVTFFASQEYTIRSAGQKKEADLKKQIGTEEQKILQVQQGPAPDKPLAEKTVADMGLDDVQMELRNLRYEQKKAWFNCKPGAVKVDGKTIPVAQLGDGLEPTPDNKLNPVKLLEVKLLITGPAVTDKDGAEAVIPPEDLKGLVYVFDEGAKNEDGMQASGGTFLGIFTVEGAAAKVPQGGYQATLLSATELNETEVQRITKSAKPASSWAVYVSMPQDRVKGIFDRLTDEQKEALKIPEELSKADRTLKDFAELLSRNFALRVELKQNLAKAKLDIASLEKSLEIAKKEDLNLRKDIEFEKKRIAAMETQGKAIADKAAEYDEQIKTLNADIDKAQNRNEWYIARIAEYQLEVKKLIEQRAAQ
ncbi:MAG: hypothetical protein LBN39_05870 [Planctomycetaceae bacterium]|jgi:uncharacterized membrane protein|nr:hypothetical protein [Planctomycetaceae bacterium]